MYFHAARQPIFDNNKKLFAYELLFREGIENVFPDIDSDKATTKIIEASRLHMGLSGFTGNKPAFINFTLETLCKGYLETLSPEEVVVEILETVKPGKRLLKICQDLHEKGYIIALDDYIHHPEWRYFYPYTQIIKVDWQDTSIDTIKEICQAIKDFPHIKLLAEKIENYTEYGLAVELGFELFQGFFFAKPEMVKTKNLAPSEFAIAELLYETSKPDINIDNITSAIERDVTLSYKLLRYVNSSFFKRHGEVSTIKQAVVTLGAVELKRFFGLMFAANINPDKPSELIKSAMVRAKFCELITQNIKTKADTSIAFLTGLLSLIDAILDEKLESILEKLPLAQEIKDSLLTRKGVVAATVTLVELIEHAQWDKVNIITDKLKIDQSDASRCYNDAIAWADEQNLDSDFN